MNYPLKLKLSVLMAENSHYSLIKPHLEKIKLLTEGGYLLRESLPKFLEKRHDEQPEVYQNRLTKFTYSNVLGSSIAQLATKFSNGTVHVDNPSNKDLLNSIREDNNGQGRTESQLINQLISDLLSYQTVYAHVDKPRSEVIPLNAAQEKALGLDPKIILYNALQVPAWSESNGVLDWVKVYQVSEDSSDPTRKPIFKATWTFIDSEVIAKYSAFVEVKNGIITKVLDRKGVPIYGAFSEVEIDLESQPIQHGFKQIPIAKVTVPNQMYSGNQAYPIAEESLKLECFKHHYLTSVYPQRIYKVAQTPDSDLENTYADSGAVTPTGLEYVLELDSFSFVEATGVILDKVKDSLESATNSIRSILSVGGAYASTEVNEASGKSKQMDFVKESERLAAYGLIVTDGLQDIYQLVAIALGSRDDSISVSGLDSFGDDDLDELIGNLASLTSLDLTKLELILAPTLFTHVKEKFTSYFSKNLTPEQKAQIKQEQLSYQNDL